MKIGNKQLIPDEVVFLFLRCQVGFHVSCRGVCGYEASQWVAEASR